MEMFSSSRDVLLEVDLLDQALFDEVSLVKSLLETNQTNFVLPNEVERRKTSENGADRNISLVGDDGLEKLKQTRIPMKNNRNMVGLKHHKLLSGSQEVPKVLLA